MTDEERQARRRERRREYERRRAADPVHLARKREYNREYARRRYADPELRARKLAHDKVSRRRRAPKAPGPARRDPAAREAQVQQYRCEYLERNRDYISRRAKAYRNHLAQIPDRRGGVDFTPAEDIIVMREDCTVKEICYILGRSYHAVTNRRHKLRNNSSPPGRPVSRFANNRAEIRQFRANGLTLADIAARYGCSIATIHHLTKDIPKPTIRCSMTDDERVAILELRADGCTLAEVAEVVGRSIKAVWTTTQNYELVDRR